MSNAYQTTDGGTDGAVLMERIQGTDRNVPLLWVYPASERMPAWLSKVGANIIDLSVSYSISAATAVTFNILDPGLEMTLQNYFQIGQTLVYRSHNSNHLLPNKPTYTPVSNEAYLGYFLEVADVTIEQSQGNAPIVRVQCYTKAIQQMKRDKKPGAIKGTSSDYVENAAKKYGLIPIVQKTSATRQISSGDSDQAADSVWTVLEKLAGEAKDENKNPFIIFESDGHLYFCTQQWLMHKWGHDSYEHVKYSKKLKKNVTEKRHVTYLHYPPRVVNGERDTRFILPKMPTMHKAENDPLEGDGSCTVDRTNGVRLRPGMTVNVGDIPWHTGNFLIQSVDFQELVNEPVQVNFATPPRQEKKVKPIEVGKIYPGSTSWALVEGLLASQPQTGSMLPPQNLNRSGGGGDSATAY